MKWNQINAQNRLDAADAKKDAEAKLINDKKSQEGQIKAETERVRLAAEAAGTIVGKGKKSAVTDKEKDEAIKANLDAQNNAKIAGTGKRVTAGLSRFAGTEFTEASVDAATAVNDVNNDDSSSYFRTVVNSILRPLDYTSHDGSVHKCISVAKHVLGAARVACAGLVRSSITDPDSISPDELFQTVEQHLVWGKIYQISKTTMSLVQMYLC